jgi:hypothetical protein
MEASTMGLLHAFALAFKSKNELVKCVKSKNKPQTSGTRLFKRYKIVPQFKSGYSLELIQVLVLDFFVGTGGTGVRSQTVPNKLPESVIDINVVILENLLDAFTPDNASNTDENIGFIFTFKACNTFNRPFKNCPSFQNIQSLHINKIEENIYSSVE